MLVERLTNPVVAPKRRKRRRRPRPASCLRRFRCYHCGAYVNVCAPCDRGQRYCSPSCRDTARAAAVRVAGIIYQRSERGREKHAARQRAYLARAVEPSNSATSHPRQPPPHLFDDRDDLAWSAPSVDPSQPHARPPPPSVSFQHGSFVSQRPHNRSARPPPSGRPAPRTNEPCCFLCAAPSNYWLSDCGKRTRYHRSRAP